MMNDGRPLIIADVRTAAEFAQGHIPGSENLPLADIDTWSVGRDKDTRICCVCASGNRSRQSADTLVADGFRQVYNLLAGLSQWTGPWEP